ncbi:MAG: CoA transferase [Smithellaceae bacterium]|jgi:crotonobetainyl-CoA:carnitine CoA-transferase CaiB-like acyl-CoA transferase
MFYKALDGIKVVELGNLISAPFCTKILADLGAEVIKVEKPDCGDDSRNQAPFLNDVPGLERSGLFQYLNMNKLGITLNVETATGREILNKLLKNADIFVENNPLKTMTELKLSYSYVKQINPCIIMTSITPFGQTGPYKDYKGGELVTTHMGVVGYISTREGDVSKEPIKYPAHLFSFQAGLSAAAVTLGAFYHKMATGLGEHIDVSEQESVIQNLNAATARYSYANQIISRTDVLSVAPSHILPCKDGYIYNALAEEHQWRRFVEVMGHPDWADNDLFKDAQTRAEYWDALKPLLLEWTMEHTVEEIYRSSQEKGVPIGAVRTADQVLSDKQMSERGFFVDIEHGEIGKLKYPGVPYKFSDLQQEAPQAAPLLGQHNEIIYCGRLGYAKRDLTKLKESGVI